jgi:hypothetical protein
MIVALVVAKTKIKKIKSKTPNIIYKIKLINNTHKKIEK